MNQKYKVKTLISHFISEVFSFLFFLLRLPKPNESSVLRLLMSQINESLLYLFLVYLIIQLVYDRLKWSIFSTYRSQLQPYYNGFNF